MITPSDQTPPTRAPMPWSGATSCRHVLPQAWTRHDCGARPPPALRWQRQRPPVRTLLITSSDQRRVNESYWAPRCGRTRRSMALTRDGARRSPPALTATRTNPWALFQTIQMGAYSPHTAPPGPSGLWGEPGMGEALLESRARVVIVAQHEIFRAGLRAILETTSARRDRRRGVGPGRSDACHPRGTSGLHPARW